MVLQQHKSLPIIGLAAPGSVIEVTLERHPAPHEQISSLDRRFGLVYHDRQQADQQGHFVFYLPELEGSYCTYTLNFSTLCPEHDRQPTQRKKAYIRRPGMPKPVEDFLSFEHILVGELWLSAGQDNMALPLSLADQGRYKHALDNNDYVRFLLMGSAEAAEEKYSFEPLEQAPQARWTRAGHVIELRKVSALAASFARHIQESLDVPVGIIACEAVSSLLHSWIPYETLQKQPEAKQHLEKLGLWREAADWEEEGNSARFQPAAFYNLRIAPLRALTCRGIIWSQGESDIAFPQYYERMLPVMLQAWSQILNPAGERLSFIYTQLAPYCYPSLSPQALPAFNQMLARIRSKLPVEAALVACHDLSLEYEHLPKHWRHPLHPEGKWALGSRMARIALGLAYAWPGAKSSPELLRMQAVGNKLLLAFSTHGERLRLGDGSQSVRGFEIAGMDKVYRPAYTRLLFGVELMLWHPDITQPVYCRYAYRELNMAGQLQTADGLPVLPFCTEESASLPNPDLDWLTFDKLERWTFPANEKPHVLPDLAHFHPVYSALPGVRYELETRQKQEGEAALCIFYQVSKPVFKILQYQEQALSPRPHLDWSRYQTLRLAFCNRDLRSKRVRLAGQDAWQVLASAQGWQDISFDLTTANLKEGLVIELEDTQGQGEILLDAGELRPIS